MSEEVFNLTVGVVLLSAAAISAALSDLITSLDLTSDATSLVSALPGVVLYVSAGVLVSAIALIALFFRNRKPKE